MKSERFRNTQAGSEQQRKQDALRLLGGIDMGRDLPGAPAEHAVRRNLVLRILGTGVTGEDDNSAQAVVALPARACPGSPLDRGLCADVGIPASGSERGAAPEQALGFPQRESHGTAHAQI